MSFTLGITLPPARRLDLKVGFACNNRCVFCAQGDKREQLPAVNGRLLLAELLSARAKADSVVFTGGEPTIHKRLVSLVNGWITFRDRL